MFVQSRKKIEKNHIEILALPGINSENQNFAI